MPIFIKFDGVDGSVTSARTESTMVATELLAPGGAPQTAGLLLPAVQKVREAARRSTAPVGPQNLQTAPQVPQLIGLLLPAVQKVREAAARHNHGTPGGITNGTAQTAGLLLPAVQKVREAAARNSGGAVAVHVHSMGSAGLLTGIKQTKAIIAILDLPDGGTVQLKDAVVFDVNPAGKGLDVVIGFGRSSAQS